MIGAATPAASRPRNCMGILAPRWLRFATSLPAVRSLSHHCLQYAPNTYLSVCEWGLDKPWTWAPKIAATWRVGPDHIPAWWMPNGSASVERGEEGWLCCSHVA